MRAAIAEGAGREVILSTPAGPLHSSCVLEIYSERPPRISVKVGRSTAAVWHPIRSTNLNSRAYSSASVGRSDASPRSATGGGVACCRVIEARFRWSHAFEEFTAPRRHFFVVPDWEYRRHARPFQVPIQRALKVSREVSMTFGAAPDKGAGRC